MPAQVDGNIAEVLLTAGPHGHVQGSIVEVLWGTAGVVRTQESAEHTQVAEVLVTAQDVAQDTASVAELLWLDLTLQVEVDTQVAEVLWGTPAILPTQYAGEYSSVVEVLSVPPPLVDELTSMAEVLVKYDRAVADVLNIVGRPGTPAMFDGSTSLGAISQYRWSWVSVPVGSSFANSSEPYPDSGGIVPIDMTSNAVLYHAEETAGVVGTDTSGNTNNAALTAITVGVAGIVGSYAWEYTGSTSVATLGSAVSLASGNWTVAFWFYNLQSVASDRTGVEGQTAHRPILVVAGSDELGAYEDGVGFHGCGFNMPSASYTGWHHVAAVGISDGIDFYVDGVFAGGINGFKPVDVDGLYTIGNAAAGSQRFAERVDEFAAWNRSLSGSEVADIYILQKGTFTGVGITHTFIPDLEGTYTILLQVVSASTGILDNDTADAAIAYTKFMRQFPLQGDAIRQWGHLQGSMIRRRDEK